MGRLVVGGQPEFVHSKNVMETLHEESAVNGLLRKVREGREVQPGSGA